MLKKWLFLSWLLMALVSASVSEGVEVMASATLLWWRASQGDFSAWQLDNVELTNDGALRLVELAGLASPSGVVYGEATGPVVENVSFQEAIASWNAPSPAGTWMDVQLRVRKEDTWSEWYFMGIWSASSEGSVQRHSVTGQEDQIARVAVDTLLMQSGAADAVQMKVRLRSEVRGALPVVRNVALALSDHPTTTPILSSGDANNWNRVLPVPGCSQFAYPDGNETWASPTSIAMVLRYWSQRAGQEIGSCESWLRAALDGVYDHAYGAYGNWPFNVAYATTSGYDGYITRLTGLHQAEAWVASGVPLVMSLGWSQGELDNAPLPSSAGHLVVLSGFDSNGNPIVHDPAASADNQVQRTYQRQQFERLWLSHSGGVTYVIAPAEFFEPPVTLSEMPMLRQWKASEGQFADWQLNNIALTNTGALRILLANQFRSADRGTFSGEATSPVIEHLSFEEAIASWNAQAPSGTWIEVFLRVRANHEWSQWFQMGVWTAASNGTVQRHSVADQQDEIARIGVDTLVMQSRHAEGLQLRVRLYSESSDTSPLIENMAIALSDHPSANPTLSSGNPALWGNALSVPGCSQMVYPDGGEIWCSPTSVSMVLRYWAQQAGEEVGECEPRVRTTVNGVYDYVYKGHGNWPFNVAYASTQGMEGYITRLSGLDEAEQWIARGVPLIISYGWSAGELDNAPFEYSTGHIAVLSGFDEAGNPIVHDPGGSSNQAVRRVYRRDQFERLWLSHSAGTTYVIMPPEVDVIKPLYQLYIPIVISNSS